MRHKFHYYFIPHQTNNFRPHILRPHFLSAYSLLVVVTKIFLTVSLVITYPSATAFAEITTRDIIDLTNKSRTDAGLNTLSENSLLDNAALAKAKDMLNKGYFNHEDPTGLMPWHFFKENGYLYTYAGENLAMDFIRAETIHKAWMESESHRENILNPNYQEIGVAVVQGKLQGRKTTFLVQFFGTSYAPKLAQEIPKALPPETPFATVQSTDESRPQLKGGEVTVTLKSEPRNDFFSNLIYYTQKFYWVFLTLLLIAFLVNIFVRVKVQHKSVIIQTVLVLLLIVIMISLQTHFLENLPAALKII